MIGCQITLVIMLTGLNLYVYSMEVKSKFSKNGSNMSGLPAQSGRAGSTKRSQKNSRYVANPPNREKTSESIEKIL